MKTHKCSQCARGEIDQIADVLVRGKFNGRPYRAYLCEDHLDAFTAGYYDADIVVERELNQGAHTRSN
jgi:hypothetical protein